MIKTVFNIGMLFALCFGTNATVAQTGRIVKDLSNYDWKLWLDTAATWQHDPLFASYNKSRVGLRLQNGETVVACVADHKPEVYSALSIVPHGRGKIILCTLDIYACLQDVKVGANAEGDGENAAMNTFNGSQTNKANVVGQQLLLNLIRFAGK